MSRKTIFFDSYCGYAMAAVVEDGKICEFNFEKKGRVSITGNVYKGRVVNVLPGMNAAFIDCGLERNCYLSAEDAMPDLNAYDGETDGGPCVPALKEGDEIAVQVLKPPVGKKGARVTAALSFVGKHIIYLPRTPFIGVSRKIADAELRKNLIYSAGKMKDSEEGIILRTAAPYATRAQLQSEFGYLKNLYAGVEKAAAQAGTGALLYTDLELPMRVMRDTLDYDIEKIVVGSEELYKLISALVELYPPDSRRPVVLHGNGRDMMDDYGLSEQVAELASSKVGLDNGAYLVIDKTEALTVIDVNTGKFTGGDTLEQTVYYTNILAAREIARQVRLRNIGGIVVVDFIDMNSAAHRKSIVEELERALSYDAAKCRVAPMSPFGLVEFTRKRTGGNPLSLITKQCRFCGNGRVKSPRYTIIGMRARLLKAYADGAREIKIDMNAEVFGELFGWKEFISDLKDRLCGAKIYAVPHATYGEDQLHLTVKDFSLSGKAQRLI